MLSEKLLLDRVILVSGASSGLGARFAYIAAEASAKIVIGARRVDRLFAINVRGTFLTARSAARRLQSIGRDAEGRIVLISSITAKMQSSGTVAYSASKASVTHMGRVLAREWARTGPNVNILSPGYIRSELAGDWFDTEGGKRHMSSWPRKRLLEENALDATLLYLLSDGSSAITGSEFVIDDGQSL